MTRKRCWGPKYHGSDAKVYASSLRHCGERCADKVPRTTYVNWYPKSRHARNDNACHCHIGPLKEEEFDARAECDDEPCKF